MLFVFDTSSFIVLGHYYPDQFPTFWELFEKSIKNSEIISVREVYNELDKQIIKPWFLKWIKDHSKMFEIASPDETEFVGNIFKVRHFHALVSEKNRLRGTPVADPFVIAKASGKGGIVISEEGKKQNAAKIPNVCDHFGIQCSNVEGFLSKNGWKF